MLATGSMKPKQLRNMKVEQENLENSNKHSQRTSPPHQTPPRKPTWPWEKLDQKIWKLA
jgi:hypothetical protein